MRFIRHDRRSQELSAHPMRLYDLVLEEPALDVSRRIIPFADKGGTLRSRSRRSLAS